MWYTYDQRIYMYVYIHICELCGHEVKQSIFGVLAEFYDPTNPFQSQVRQAASAAGDMFTGHGMNQFRLVTTWSSHHIMQCDRVSCPWPFHQSKFFVPIPLPPYCIKWCQYASIKWCVITFINSVQVNFPSNVRALYQWHSYQYNLIFKPFLHQFFTPNVNWLGLTKSYVKSMILVTSRMNTICKKPLCTSSMCDNVYGQCVHSWSWGWQSRWFNWRVSFETISASTTTFPSWTWTSVRSPISHPDFPLWPTHSQSAPHGRQSTCTPIEKKGCVSCFGSSAWKRTTWLVHGRRK